MADSPIWRSRHTSERESLESNRNKLFEAVKDSTDKNRQFFVAWVLFATYVNVIVFSTTDIQLLTPDSTVSLPALSIQLPLLGFYLAAPVLVVVVHFNLVQNLETHSYKLGKWATEWNDSPPREQLGAFIFDLAVLERNSTFGIFVRAGSELLCYWLGPITLSILLIRFSDYQNAWYTSWHGAVLLADLLLVVVAIRRITIGRSVEESQLTFRRHQIADGLICAIAVGPALFAWALVVGLAHDFTFAHQFMATARASGPSLTFVAELFLPRLVLPNGHQASLIPADIDRRAKAAGKSVDDWWRTEGHGVNLQGRNLAYAELVQANLRKADLRSARLPGATLREAQLQGADLSGASLYRAELVFAQLHDAEFGDGIDLRETFMIRANLQGASLRYARLEGAHLQQALMQGVDLSYAKLTGADLSLVALQGAILVQAHLQGAILYAVRAHGAILFQARVEGAALADIALTARPQDLIGLPFQFSIKELADTTNWGELKQRILTEVSHSRIQEAESRASNKSDDQLSQFAVEYSHQIAAASSSMAGKLASELCGVLSGPGDSNTLASILFRTTWPGMPMDGEPGGRWYSPRVGFDTESLPARTELFDALAKNAKCANHIGAICAAAKSRLHIEVRRDHAYGFYLDPRRISKLPSQCDK